MIKPLLVVVAAAALLAACGEVEEEVVSQRPVATPTLPSAGASIPTSFPQPAGWETYDDKESGVSLPSPVGLAVSVDFTDLPENEGIPIRARLLIFRNAAGVPALSLGIAPNPNDLSLEDWAKTYTGFPSQPQSITIGGEPALLFPIDQMGERHPQVYFRHGGSVFVLAGNVYGSRGGDPVLSEADFQRVIEGFRFGR